MQAAKQWLRLGVDVRQVYQQPILEWASIVKRGKAGSEVPPSLSGVFKESRCTALCGWLAMRTKSGRS